MKKSGLLLLLLTSFVLLAVLLTACKSSDGKNDNGKTSDETTVSDDQTGTTGTITTKYGPLPEILTGERFEDEDLTKYVKIAPYETHVFPKSAYQERYDYYNGAYMYRCGLYDPLPANTALKLYDSAVFSFEGRPEDPAVILSEETLARMKSEEDEIVLGSNSFIGAYHHASDPSKNTKGFEEQMVGMKIGEKKELLVTFPDGYSEELGGVRVIFAVEIKSASEPGRMTDAVAVENGFESAEAFYNDLGMAVKNELLYQYIIEETEILGYPEKDINELKDEYLDSFVEYMQQYAQSEMSEEERAELRKNNEQDAIDWAQSYAKESMIVALLGKMENQTVTKEEYINWIAEQYDADAPYTDVENYYGRDVLYYQILLNKSLESALVKAKFEE